MPPASDAPPAAPDGTTLYFARHGETDYNRDDVMQGRGVDLSLNATGRAQAAALADRLADVPFDVVFTSPLRRATETAAVLAAPHAPIDVHELPDLEEMSWGVYEGTGPSPERRRALRSLKTAWRDGDAFDTPIEGGESILEVQARALRAVRRILEDAAGRTALVVTHGRYLRVLLASILPGYGLHRMHEMHHSNTGLYRVVSAGGAFRADVRNSTTHLDDASPETPPSPAPASARPAPAGG